MTPFDPMLACYAGLGDAQPTQDPDRSFYSVVLPDIAHNGYPINFEDLAVAIHDADSMACIGITADVYAATAPESEYRADSLHCKADLGHLVYHAEKRKIL